MPVILLDRLPLPSLHWYTTLSVMLLSCSFYYSVKVTLDPTWGHNEEDAVPGLMEGTEGSNSSDYRNATGFWLSDAMYYMVKEPMCVWTLINMAYCCLILVGKVIQRMVFGELRVSEQQHIKDKFWNFVFYKFIFIFGVINVQLMDEVVLWCSWFSVLGFLHMLAQLSKDRFEYLSFSPTTPKWTHIRLLTLLLGILSFSFGLLCICVLVGYHAGLNTFAFMAAECVLLIVRTLYVITRYGIYLWDINHEGVWETRGTYVYYTELLFELTALGFDFFHHLHMFLWGNIFLSMASLVICMQLRYLFYEIQRRFRKHSNYLKVVRYMEKNYPMATEEELESNSDDCAVCWDKMDSARKLPCGHFFHNSCLRSWLEQDTSCPTCRQALNVQNEIDNGHANEMRNILSGFGVGLGGNADGNQANNRPMTNHFFHFDASRYVSWLPSFSVEVTHTQLLGRQRMDVQTSQLDSMAREVHQMFPHIQLSAIQEDLRTTHSVEVTIENILEERLVPRPMRTLQDQTLEQSSINSSPAVWPSLPVVEPASDPLLPEVTEGEESNVEPEQLRLGGRFSKSPKEREVILARRKEELIHQARRRYLVRRNDGEDSSST